MPVNENLQSSLRAFQAMADFGQQLNTEQAFPERAQQMLRSLASAMASRCAAIYVVNGKTELRLVTAVQGERSRFPQNLHFAPHQLGEILSLRGPRAAAT